MSREIEPALLSQFYIDHHDVRSENLSTRESDGAGRRDAGDRDSLALQELACGLEKGRIVVHDEASQRHARRMPEGASNGMVASRSFWPTSAKPRTRRRSVRS